MSPNQDVLISLKKQSEVRFQIAYRALLYDAQLHWGAKCLGLALIDLPGEGYFDPAAMARKLRTDDVCISRWLKELKSRGFNFYIKKRVRGGSVGATGSVWPPQILNYMLLAK